MIHSSLTIRQILIPAFGVFACGIAYYGWYLSNHGRNQPEPETHPAPAHVAAAIVDSPKKTPPSLDPKITADGSSILYDAQGRITSDTDAAGEVRIWNYESPQDGAKDKSRR